MTLLFSNSASIVDLPHPVIICQIKHFSFFTKTSEVFMIISQKHMDLFS